MVASASLANPVQPEQDLLFSRSQIVSRILELNPSSSAEFLDGFTDESLAHYLARLNILQQPRPARTGWIRTSETPAIVCREPAD